MDITPEDARYLIAIEHGFGSWAELAAFAARIPSGLPMTATPVGVSEAVGKRTRSILSSRHWGSVLRALAEHPGATLEPNGQINDEMLEQISRITHITSLDLGNSKAVTDAGIRHLARMPQLRELDLSQTGVTDAGLRVLRELPALESLSLVMTAVTDTGLESISHGHALQKLNVMWTRTGDGAIRLLAGKSKFTHLWSGNYVTNAGLALLHALPAFTQWRGGEARFALLGNDSKPNQLVLRGAFTDSGMEHLRALEGLFSLDLADSALPISARGLAPLTALPHLAALSVDAKDDWMPHIANMRALRFLSAQDTTATDSGWETLSQSASIEYIWGRRSHGLGTRGFKSLGQMPKLRGLSLSCLHVDDTGIATLPQFPALRELMPMDIPDAGYRHIGQCDNLEALLLMYCRDTTDAATEHITRLSRLTRYFNSYTTITDRTPELLSSMDSLEHITFDACPNITNEGIIKLARLPRLTELRVSGNRLTGELAAAFPEAVSVHYAR
jgi:Leucine-rich repeat (LRR) protein